MTTQVEIDQAKLEAFVGKAVGDASGMLAVVLSFLGDRLGLFRELAKEGSATSEELAQRAGVDERYAREWLRGLHAAGYLEYERESERFSLPPEQAQVLAVEGGPFFLGGAYHTLMGELRPIDRLADAFHLGRRCPAVRVSRGHLGRHVPLHPALVRESAGAGVDPRSPGGEG